MTDLFLGIDLGTSSAKAIIADRDGRLVASGTAGYATVREHHDQAEQDAADWIVAVGEAVRQALRDSGEPATSVAGVGLTGQLPTLVCVGRQQATDVASGRALGRAITWQDGRADAWVRDRLDQPLREHLHKTTGMPIDGRYLAPMFRFHWWQRRNEIDQILSAKDYLCLLLTGRAVTDPSTAAGYGVYDLARARWDPALCALWDLPPELLPGIDAAEAIAGPLTRDGASMLGLEKGTPVSVGAADAPTAAYAMSGLDPRCVSIIMGSGTVIVLATQDREPPPGAKLLVTPHVRKGWFGREADILATGTGFAWLGDVLGRSADGLQRLALQSPAGANGLLFAPYLAGAEQGAVCETGLCGVIHGLGLRHGAADLVRAYLEGVFFEMRRCVAALRAQAPIERVVLSGRIVEEPGLVTLASQILDCAIEPFQCPSAAALGAAMIASGTAPPQAKLVPAAARVSDADALFYDSLFSQYVRAFPRLARADRVEVENGPDLRSEPSQ